LKRSAQFSGINTASGVVWAASVRLIQCDISQIVDGWYLRMDWLCIVFNFDSGETETENEKAKAREREIEIEIGNRIKLLLCITIWIYWMCCSTSSGRNSEMVKVDKTHD
jgi:hypothetical protein